MDAPVLVLGTAQLGLPHYGRTNQTGRLPHAAAVDLVRQAVANGVQVFDTARAYGAAEQVLGEALADRSPCPQVVTKLDPLLELTAAASTAAVREAVDRSLAESCHTLRCACLPVVLLHRWSHRRDWSGAVWNRLRERQQEGVIGALGASVYSPAEAAEALADSTVRHLQIPFNLLDGRWLAAGIDQLVRGRPDVTVHARSLFLQGLLLNAASFWPPIAEVPAVELGRRLDYWVERLGRKDRMDLCLAFGRAQSWLGGLVLGVDTADQLAELVACFRHDGLSGDQVQAIQAEFAGLPETLLNPSLWPSPPARASVVVNESPVR